MEQHTIGGNKDNIRQVKSDMYRKGKDGLSDICVVGCGPSLKGFDWSLLKDRTTIAVNGAVMDVPKPDYLITADSRFARMAVRSNLWDIHTYKILVMGNDHRCFHKIVKDLHFWDHRIIPRHFDGNIGFSETEFCTGQNSGFCGMQLAVILGARIIRLFGMDFHTEGGEHYHTRYSSEPTKLEEFLAHFKTAIKTLTKYGIDVISHSQTSRLNDLIPYAPMENHNVKEDAHRGVALYG